MDMASVARKLERNHEISVANPMDLNSMALKGLRRDDLDLLHYLNRLARVVLGKHVFVFRPCRYKVEWFQKYDRGNYSWYNAHFFHEKLAEAAKTQFSHDYSDHLALFWAYKGWKEVERDVARYEYCWKNFLLAQTIKAIDVLRGEFYSSLKEYVLNFNARWM
ncbi:hypothetical protein CsSME_00048322 [Camellia sinensis var. sinensis]